MGGLIRVKVLEMEMERACLWEQNMEAGADERGVDR